MEMKWQPIETAPKTGFFLVCGSGHDLERYQCSVAAVYRDRRGELIAYLEDDGCTELQYLDGPATHWMPLPEPPE